MRAYTINNFIEFSNLKLSFDTNYCNLVSFVFNNLKYSWLIIQKSDYLYLYEPQKMLVKAVANQPLRHNDFNFALFSNQGKTENITTSNLFSKYKLAILNEELNNE